MNEPEVFQGPCAICKVRKATRLCDFTISYNRYPIFLRDYTRFEEVNSHPHDETCDLPLCDKCSHNVGGADLCPHHYNLYRQAELPDEKLRVAQLRSKAKIYKKLMEEGER